MTPFLLTMFVLKYFIPGIFSVLFRAFGLGYKNKKRLIIGLTAYTVYTLGVTTLLILVMGYGEFTHLSPVVMAAGSALVLIFSTDSVWKTLFLQLTQGCMTTAVSVVLNYVRTACNLSYPVLVLMIAVVFPLLYVLALRYWSRPLRFIGDNLHAELHAMVAMPVLVTVMVSLLPVFPEQNFSRHPLVITLMMLTVEAIYFLFIFTYYRNLLKISNLLRDSAKAQLLESELQAYQESLNAAKEMRHDLRHHNAVVLDFLTRGDQVGAISYLQANDGVLAQSKLTELSVNPTVNAVLRIFSRRAQTMQVRFTVRTEAPQEMEIGASDMGALLSNLLENALESCAKVAEGKRMLDVQMLTDDAGIRMEVRNSVCGTVCFKDELPVSTKPGGGTGTRSIAAIVHRYGGMLRFKQEQDCFITQVFLPYAR